MKKLLAICLALFLTVIPFTAFAEETGKRSVDTRLENLQKKLDNLEQRKAEAAQKKQQIETKKQNYEAFRKTLKEKHDISFDNRKENITLMQDNRRLSVELKNSLETIKENGITLDEETTAKLAILTEKLKSLRDALKDTKGDIKAVMEEYKSFAKDKDYASMELMFEKIHAIQEFRTAQLTEIGNTLKEMITLLAAVA